MLIQKSQQLLRFALSSDAFKQSFILTAATFFTGMIMAVAMIIASRALGPEKFGVFSVAMSISLLFSKGLDLGLHLLIPKFYNKWIDDKTKLSQLISQVVQWKLWLAVITLVLGLLSVQYLVSVLNYPYPLLMTFAIFGGIFASFYEYIYLILSALHKFLWVSVLSIAQAVLKAIGFVAVFLSGVPSVSFITVAYFLPSLIVSLWLIKRFFSNVWAVPKSAPKAMRLEMFKFLKHSIFGVIAMTLIGNIDLLLVQKYLDPLDTGIYAGATRIASLVIFVTSAIGGVLNNRAARYQDVETLKKYLKKSWLVVAAALIGFICFLPFANIAIIYTIGPEYLSGYSTLIILVFNSFLSLAIVPYISFFYGVNHPRFFSLGGIIQVLIIYLGSWFFLPEYGIIAAAISRAVATLVFGVFISTYIWYALNKLKKAEA